MNRMFVPVICLLVAGCSRDSAAPKQAQAVSKPAPIAIQTATVAARSVDRNIQVTGSLVADEKVNLSAEVAGRVTRVPFDFGASVKKGDVVAEIDSTDYRLQLDRTKASLAQAMARIGLAPGDALSKAIDTPSMRQARAQLEDAKSKFDRTKQLVDSGDMARERLTEAEKLLAARQAAYDATGDDLRTQLANIDAIRAELRLAEERLADTIVRAPFDGTISERMVSPGQYIKDNVAIVTLVKTWPLRLRVDVPETGAGVVKPGDTLTFTVQAFPGKSFQAVVQRLDPVLNEQARALQVEARLSSADAALRPGMFVQVDLTVQRNAQVSAVPEKAIYTIAGLTKLYSVKGSQATEHKLDPRPAVDGWVELPPGLLAPGDQVATTNQHLLTNGSEVTIAAR